MITILPAKFRETTAMKDQDEDCFDVFLGQECYFLDEDSNDNVLFEKPDDVMKSHLWPLHIKASIVGKMVNWIFVNGGAAINLLPESMLVKFGKTLDQLIKANIVVTDFTGKTSILKGMIVLR